MAAIDPHQVRAAVMQHAEDAHRQRARQLTARYKYARPLSVAAYDLIESMSDDSRRLNFGLDALDAAVRGVARGELAYVTGKAHSGKTQLILHAVRSQPEKRLLYCTPDEVSELVLTKLIALVHGINAEELERRVKGGDRNARRLIRMTAETTFANLAINDQALTFRQMGEALDEAQEQWGEACDGVIVDYLDLLPGEADYNGTKGKSVGLKRWTKEHEVPTICVHQPKRGGSVRGDLIGMDDMNQGGETEATFVLGVYRKRDDRTLAWDERARHANTLSVNLDKNKRPPCITGSFDFYMDSQSGRLRELRGGDQVMPGDPLSASEAIGYRTEQRPVDTDKVIELAVRRPA